MTDEEVEVVARALFRIEWREWRSSDAEDVWRADRDYWFASARAAIVALDAYRKEKDDVK